MNDHKKVEQAQRDQMVEAYLKDVGATVCPPATYSDVVVAKQPSSEDRVMRTQYYAGLTDRQKNLYDYAPCNDAGIESGYLNTSTGEDDDL